MIHKVSQFILEGGNSYPTDEVVNLNKFVLGELAEEKAAKWTLAFIENRKEW